MLPFRYESNGLVQSPMDQVFAHIDDHTRLSSHMSEPSWRTGWGRLETEIDAGRGQKVGSRVRLSGRVFGVELSVEETVTERNPPRRKVWETTGAPKLLVVGHYRMGFELSTKGVVRCFASLSITLCRRAHPPVGSDACSAGITQGGVPSKWSTTQSNTSRHGLQHHDP